MNRHEAITASAVTLAPIKGHARSSAVLLTPTSTSLPSSQPADPQQLAHAGPAIREKIRQAIKADKSFSLYAHNIEIAVGPRSVTLYGPVKSQEERQRIETCAAAVVRPDKVFSKLVVRSGQNPGQKLSLKNQEPVAQSSTEEECGRIRRLWGIR